MVSLNGSGTVRARIIGAPELEPGARVALEFSGAPTVAWPAGTGAAVAARS